MMQDTISDTTTVNFLAVLSPTKDTVLNVILIIFSDQMEFA